MQSLFALGVVFKVIDKFSGPFRALNRLVAEHKDRLRELGRTMQSWGRTALIAGGIVGGAMLLPARAFAELEDASTRLGVTLMQADGGIPAAFAAIEKQAIALGNKLPGTSADFLNMAASLGALGISPE